MHGIYPDAWKSAIVMPIFKGGDQTNVENYRPISILPTVAKVAVKWFAKQLSTYLKKKTQHGAAMFSCLSGSSAQIVLLSTFLRILTFSFYMHNVCTDYL